MKKMVVGIGVLLCLLLWFSSCGTRIDDAEQPAGTDLLEEEKELVEEGDNYIVVGISHVGSESDWRIACTESLKSTFTQENGYYLIFEDAQQKQENQLKTMRDFILQEVDYIILDPIVETGWDAVLKEAKDAGIPVILVDRQVKVSDESLYTAWVGSDFHSQGVKAGRWLENYLEEQGRGRDKIRIVTLQGTLNSTAQLGRTDGFASVMEEHDNWTMLARRDGDFTQTKGQEVMEDFLNTYPDIDVVVSENDNMTFGAIEAIEAAGKTCGPDGDIIILSFDAGRAALEAMAEGKINADFECNPNLGPEVSRIIQKLELGNQVEKFQYIRETYFDPTMDLESVIEVRTY